MIEAEPVERALDARQVAGLHVRLDRRLHGVRIVAEALRIGKDAIPIGVATAAACASAGVDGGKADSCGWRQSNCPARGRARHRPPRHGEVHVMDGAVHRRRRSPSSRSPPSKP